MTSQNNKAYVENLIPGATEGEKKKMLEVLDSYGENKWWLSKDPEEVVGHQIQEKYLLIDFNHLRQMIAYLLKRPVSLKEFDEGNPYEKLKQEIRNKLKESERQVAEK